MNKPASEVPWTNEDEDDDVDEYCEHCGMYFTVCDCGSRIRSVK